MHAVRALTWYEVQFSSTLAPTVTQTLTADRAVCRSRVPLTSHKRPDSVSLCTFQLQITYSAVTGLASGRCFTLSRANTLEPKVLQTASMPLNQCETEITHEVILAFSYNIQIPDGLEQLSYPNQPSIR